MALGNWDSWVKGNWKGGREIAYRGVEVEVYKSWIYIRDEEGWRENQGFTKPTVAEINDGRMKYKNVEIVVQFYENPLPESIYFCAWFTDWDSKDQKIYFCYGVGTYGYEGSDWVGVRHWQMEMCENWIKNNEYIYEEIKKQIPIKET